MTGIINNKSIEPQTHEHAIIGIAVELCKLIQLFRQKSLLPEQ